MGNKKDLNQTTAQLVLNRKYIDEATLQDCILEVELVDGGSLLDLLHSKGFVEAKDYQDLKMALKLTQTAFRGEQEEILLAKLLVDSQMVDQMTLEKAFLKQEKFKGQGITKGLSEILVEMRAVEQGSLDEASHMIQHMEVRCEKCEKKFLLKGLDREASLQCPHCAFILLPDTRNIDFSDMMVTMAPNTSAPASPGSMGGDTALEQFDTISEAESQAGETTTTTDRFIGRKLGECRLVKKLGQGGMGAVYLGENLKLSRREAIKVLTSEVTASSEQLIRFQREARAAGTLDSPHIVRVLNIGEDQGIHYISMEFVEGQSLQDMINAREKISVVDSINYIRQSARGLMAAHEKDIIHRDIKPDNLMVHKDGIVKVADFGLARKIEDTMGITQSGAIMGTPYYMSPEQSGGNPTDHRSDIYSLGATFYYMLTGQQPFTGETPMAILLKHMNSEIVAPHLIEDSIPLSLSNVIEKMMEKDPQYRYQSLQEFIEDLNRIEEGEEIGISEGKKKRLFRKRVKRLVTTVLVILLVGAVYLLASGRQKSPEELKDEYQTDLVDTRSLFEKAKTEKDLEKWTLVIQKLQNAVTREDYKVLDTSKSKKFLYDVYLEMGNQFYVQATGLADLQKNKGEIPKLYNRAYEEYNKAKDVASKYNLKKDALDEALDQLSRGFLQMGVFFLSEKDFKNTQSMLDKARGVSENVKISSPYKTLEEALKRAREEEVVRGVLENLAKKLDPNLKLEGLQKKTLETLFRELPDSRLDEIPPALKEGKNPSPTQIDVIQLFNKSWEDEKARRQKEGDELMGLQNKLQDMEKEKQEKIKKLDSLFNQQAEKIALGVIKGLMIVLEKFKSEFDTSLLSKEEKEYAFKFRETASKLNKKYQIEKKEVKERFKNYQRKINFISGCQKFFQDFKKPEYKKGKNLYDQISQKERYLLKAAPLAYEDPSPYTEALQKFAKEAQKNIFEAIYEKAKKLYEAEETREKSRELLINILLHRKEKRAEELLAKIRTPQGFVYMPGGNYSLGSEIPSMENPSATLELSSLYISKYELSNEEYRLFVLAGGYYQNKYWSSDGWKLFQKSERGTHYKPWPEGWDQLLQVKDQKVSFLLPPQDNWKNLPVTGVSFYEAQAYCRWLSEKRSREENKKILVRLPSRAEWEVAASYDARGAYRRIYPWGDKFEGNPVAQFKQEFPRSVKQPLDISLLNCFNMGGNVSEWVIISSVQPNCGGVRGASFEATKAETQATCAFAGFRPKGEYRFEDVGFRICIETDAYKAP